MSQQVQAQFNVVQYSRLNGWIPGGSAKMCKVQLSGVQGEPFGTATPQANIEMLIANPEAAQVFQDAFENGQVITAVFSVAVPDPSTPTEAPDQQE